MKRLKLGDYEVHDSGLGFSSIKQTSSGEVMHSVNPAQEEAHNLYVMPAKIHQRLKTHKEVVIWDVGFGAAHNSMAIIHEFQNLELPGKIKIISFENDTDPLKLALRNAPLFPHLHHAAPGELIKNNRWASEKDHIEWELIQGDFAQKFTRGEKPHVIFYDPFSLHTSSELWSEEIFTKIFNYCKSAEVQLLNYSASTAVRATLLASGWSVGPGPASGPKSTTTVAFNDPKLAVELEMNLLGQDWLTRWEHSHTKTARDLSHTDEEEFAARIRQHPQFK